MYHLRKMLVGILLLIPMLLIGATGNAEQEGRITRLRKLYQKCVLDSVASEAKTASGEINPSAVTELAFQACRTEEQAILAEAYAAGLTPVQASQAMSDYKLSLKQSIRKAFSSPEKYAPASAQEPIPAPADIPLHPVLVAQATNDTTAQQST